MADNDATHQIATFEETVRRFGGLSTEEIWDLQRVLVRRVRGKVSQSLSPEGQAAMEQAREDMHEQQKELEKEALMSSASLVAAYVDLKNGHIPTVLFANADVNDQISLDCVIEEEVPSTGIDQVDTRQAEKDIMGDINVADDDKHKVSVDPPENEHNIHVLQNDRSAVTIKVVTKAEVLRDKQSNGHNSYAIHVEDNSINPGKDETGNDTSPTTLEPHGDEIGQ